MLQTPIICRAGFVVCLGNIDLDDLGVVTHHLQQAVTEQRMQGDNIAA